MLDCIDEQCPLHQRHWLVYIRSYHYAIAYVKMKVNLVLIGTLDGGTAYPFFTFFTW